MRRMQEFTEVLSPLSWLLFHIGFFPMWIVLFKPSIFELVLLFAIDIPALFFTYWVDKKLFLKLYPETVPYFPEVRWDEIKNFKLEKRINLFHSLVRFPERRIFYCLLISIFKTVPAHLLIVFYWKHEISNLSQFALSLFTSLIGFSYFYGAGFIENHELVSRKIIELHKRLDWKDVFSQAKPSYSKRQFELRETIALFATATFVLVLHCLILLAHKPSASFDLGWKVSIVSIGGLIVFSRVWYLARNYFYGGLEYLFNIFESFDPTHFKGSLALHSSPVLARFELIINTMLERLRSYEQELTLWTLRKTEENRYLALGEVAALVVHDLSAPLHVIQFCTNSLSENPELAREQKYIKQLRIGEERAINLVNSLRAYLKNPEQTQGSTCLSEVHEYVLKLLEVQFYKYGYGKIQIDFDLKLKKVWILLSMADSVHIFLNLYSNCIDNLLKGSVLSPRLSVSWKGKSDGFGTVWIQDNGTGLSSKQFEEYTTLTTLAVQKPTARVGLGMKLVRRLIEKFKGSLSVLDLPMQKNGTIFCLRLPLSKAHTQKL